MHKRIETKAIFQINTLAIKVTAVLLKESATSHLALRLI